MKIGVILPLGEDSDLGRTPSWTEIRDLALQAEGAGFDSVWVYDHLLYRYEGHPETIGVQECWSLLSALAGVTSRVELGTLVMPTGWRNPALLAKMATTVDHISGGRLILGLGTGYHQPEFDAFGYPYDHRVDRFEEELAIITGLLRDGKVDHHGTYHTIPNGELAPKPERRVPVLVACRGPRLLRLTAAHADAWNTAWYGQPSAAEPAIAQMQAACAEVGRDPATIEITVGVHVASPAEAVIMGDAEELDPNKVLTGTPAEIAAAFEGYAALGASHLIIGALAHTTYEYTRDVIAHTAEALALRS